MDGYYFDSSGLVKRYVSEPGTGWVRGIADPATGNDIILVRITAVEVVSALVRHIPPLPASLLAQALRDFKYDFHNQYQLCEVTDSLVLQAMYLAETHRLRGYDAVQLAAAIEVHTASVASGLAVTFVSADQQLNAAAVAEGLIVDNPELHP